MANRCTGSDSLLQFISFLTTTQISELKVSLLLYNNAYGDMTCSAAIDAYYTCRQWSSMINHSDLRPRFFFKKNSYGGQLTLTDWNEVAPEVAP